MARVVRLGDTSDPAEAIQPFPEDTREREGSAHEDENSSPLAPVEKQIPGMTGLSSVEPSSTAGSTTGPGPRPVAEEVSRPGVNGVRPAGPAPGVLAAARRVSRVGTDAGLPVAVMAGGLWFSRWCLPGRRRRRS
jgi:hypothetical protein